MDDPGDRRIAVIVDHMGDINIDAKLIADQTEEDLIGLSNGCICCRLEDDLVTQAIRLAEERSFDYLVVEASGISEPVPIAHLRRVVQSDAVRDDPTRIGASSDDHVPKLAVVLLDVTLTRPDLR